MGADTPPRWHPEYQRRAGRNRDRFLAGDPAARLAVGWRAELVGERIRRLVDGEAALAFDGAGNLVLEDRAP